MQPVQLFPSNNQPLVSLCVLFLFFVASADQDDPAFKDSNPWVFLSPFDFDFLDALASLETTQVGVKAKVTMQPRKSSLVNQNIRIMPNMHIFA